MSRSIHITITLLFATVFTSESQVTFQNYFGNLTYDDDGGQDVIITSDSCYLFTGRVLPFSAAGYELMILKTTFTGTILWKKLYGCGLNEIGKKIKETFDGGYIIAGISGVTAGDWHSYFIRTDSNGDTLWTKTFWENYADERINDVYQTPDSGFLFVGNLFSQSSHTGLYLIKTDSSGNFLWAKSYGGTRNGVSIIPVDSSFIIGGASMISSTNLDILLMKINSNGDTLWTSSFGGSANEELTQVSPTKDKGYILTGRTSSSGFGLYDIFLVKTDSAGNVLWAKTYGSANQDEGTSVTQTSDNGYIITGSRENILDKALIMKTDSAGGVIWSCTYTNGLSYTYASALKPTYDGGFIMTGTNDDGIVSMIKIDSTGESGCSQQYVTIASLTASFYASQPPPLIKYNVNTIDYGGATVSSPGGTFHNGCLSLNVGLNYFTNEIINIYPNPARSNLTIDAGNYSIKTVEVGSILGETKMKIFNKINSSILQFDFDNTGIPAGIYFVKVQTENGSIVKKLIVQ
jgi:hypothetical protein